MHPVLAASDGGGSPLGALLFPLLLGLVFFFLVIRPQRARAKAAQSVKTSLQPGAQVMTTSGIFGTVQAMDDEAVTVEIAPGVPVRFLKGAISKVVTPTVTQENADFPPDDSPVP